MRYGTGPEVLRDVSFTIEAGAFAFIAGPSGAGKSSLLRLLSLSLRPSRGLITLFGRDLATLPREEAPALRRRIGVVFQDFRLMDHLTAVENVMVPLRVSDNLGAESLDNVRELLEWVGLGDRMEARPSVLSGGEQQRVAIARAVVNRPRLLIADEPTGSIDDRLGYRLMFLFQELNKLGTTVLIATHNDALIERFPHPVLLLHDGALEAAKTGPGRLR